MAIRSPSRPALRGSLPALLSLLVSVASAGPGHPPAEVLVPGEALTRPVLELQLAPLGVALDTRIIDVGDLPDGMTPPSIIDVGDLPDGLVVDQRIIDVGDLPDGIGLDTKIIDVGDLPDGVVDELPVVDAARFPEGVVVVTEIIDVGDLPDG